jgi:hypothetical protein
MLKFGAPRHVGKHGKAHKSLFKKGKDIINIYILKLLNQLLFNLIVQMIGI